jgi:Caudovirus prohead serine protease
MRPSRLVAFARPRKTVGGVFFNGEFDLDIPRDRQAYSGAKKGYLKGLSIGYRAITSRYDQKGARHLAEVQLFEGSPVTFPANDLAQVASVKSRGFGGALAAAELGLTMTMIGIDLELALLKASAPPALDCELARVDDLLARFDKAVRRGSRGRCWTQHFPTDGVSAEVGAR